jgi:hypothetical protein
MKILHPSYRGNFREVTDRERWRKAGRFVDGGDRQLTPQVSDNTGRHTSDQ